MPIKLYIITSLIKNFFLTFASHHVASTCECLNNCSVMAFWYSPYPKSLLVRLNELLYTKWKRLSGLTRWLTGNKRLSGCGQEYAMFQLATSWCLFFCPHFFMRKYPPGTDNITGQFADAEQSGSEKGKDGLCHLWADAETHLSEHLWGVPQKDAVVLLS